MTDNRGICVIVSGGRDYNEAERIWKLLDHIHERRGIDLLCHGACKYGGADIHAENWAKSREVHYLGMPAKFTRDGPRAGPERNRDLVKYCNPHMVICFPGGSGTASMKREAEKAGVWTVDLSGRYKISMKKLMTIGHEADTDQGVHEHD